jgi:hypothetical protein
MVVPNEEISPDRAIKSAKGQAVDLKCRDFRPPRCMGRRDCRHRQLIALMMSAMHVLELHTSKVIVVDKFGSETIVYDSDDHIVDGHTHVSIGPSPVYLRLDSGGRK